VKFLLDTHTILWFLSEPEYLSVSACDAILNTSNEIYVSMASAWEVAIKISLGKLSFDGGVDAFLQAINENGFALFPILPAHIALVSAMPFKHRDPFDRLLIATAHAEDMCIITKDANISNYDLDCLW